MDLRPSEPELPLPPTPRRAAAVTPVQLVWNVPPPVARPARQTGSHAIPAMHELTAIARDLAGEEWLTAGIAKLQRAMVRLLHVTDALCVWMDWPRRIAWTITGRLSDQTQELVAHVAGSGHREMIGSSIIEPIGAAPARAVLALRRPTGGTFGADELAMITTLAAGIAPSIERLIVYGR